MQYELSGKVVLITGAAGGIGAAAARALYRQGASLLLTDLRQDDVDRLAVEFDDGRVLAKALDVTDRAASGAVVDQAVAQFGRLDIVIANAGICWNPARTVLTADEAEFERIIEVDLLGVWRTVRAALPEVIRNQGQVVATSSIYAFLNGTINAPYAMSKAGVEAFMRALRVELAGSGASASVLYPGFVATAMTDLAFGGDDTATRFLKTALPGPLRRRMTPERIAKELVRGLRRRRPRIIAPRRWTPVALLRGLVNAVFDRRLAHDAETRALVARIEAAADTTVAAPDQRAA